MSNWIEVHQEKVQRMLVKYIDDKKYTIGFFEVDGSYCFFTCHVDSMDGVLYKGLIDELNKFGQAFIMMFLDYQ